MDSMRSLNTSLPGGMSPPKQQNTEPPEQLLQAFKSAALAVTKLYKTASVDQHKSRAEGYQDALDELLMYLDKEDIGLSDGEGWKVRRWATERLDGRDSISQPPESDDETSEKTDRGSSPVIQRSQSVNPMSSTLRTTRTASPVRPDPSASPTDVTPTPTVEAVTNANPPQGSFTFRSTYPYPQDPDILLSDLDISDTNRAQSNDSSATSHATTNPSSSNRPPRTNSRHNGHSTRITTRASNPIGRGAGQKRKINFDNFFDIGNLSHSKEFGGGSGAKRGRFI